MKVATIQQFLETEFPQVKATVISVGEKSCKIRSPVSYERLRPGGTVSGPHLMEAADLALYVAILNEVGLIKLAYTTNLNINFLATPSADFDIIADCRLIKVGKRLVIGEVSLYSEGGEEPVAHVTGTYSLPPKEKN